MKRLYIFSATLAAMSMSAACSTNHATISGDDPVEVSAIEVALGGLNASGPVGSRNVDDFAVNTASDPTHSMTGRNGWRFDVQIYKGDAPFTPYGTASMQWDGAGWIPVNTTLFFPNYSRQRLTIEMYPELRDAEVEADQSDQAKLLAQDLLAQSDPEYRINPAHTLSQVPVYHSRSMLDFILHEVDITRIAGVEVVAAGVTYQPYKIPKTAGFTKEEYLLVLPVGVGEPEIHITTLEGARYVERLQITTAANVCFCVNLLGLELTLGGITISDWTYGEALTGEYNVVTSYPTFKGPAGEELTLLYDNGLTQILTFNSRGEFTTKPAGRTIVRINEIVPANPIVLRSMMIDLNPYLQ